MINKIDLEFIQALNPMYAIPIVGVIFFAFLVYAIGFKSPVQPPSFHGIEEEKKVTKKKKTKETKSKLQNGKANGSAILKNQSPKNKKKEAREKNAPIEKVVTEKPVASEKKVAKKSKQQNEKQKLVEKKIEVLPDDDDGWVQLVKKKSRKNRKKDETSASEKSSSKSTKNADVSKSDESSQVDDSPKSSPPKSTPLKGSPSEIVPEIIPQAQSSAVVEEKLVSSKAKKASGKAEKGTLHSEKIQDQVLIVEVVKSEVSDFQKRPLEESVTQEVKVLEESSSKSKKKKKKAADVAKEKGEADANVSEKTSVQIIADIPTSEEKITTNVIVTSDYKEIVSGKVETDKSSDAKASNIAFDELAGLYPEAKEQKKKKKVRRDH